MKVELIANLGDDLTVVNAARVSFDKQSSWKRNIQAFGEKELHEKDIKMFRQMLRPGAQPVLCLFVQENQKINQMLIVRL